MSAGSCEPSASMKTTISPVASREREAQGLALAAPAVADDARAVRDGDVARAVPGVAVDDEHLVGVRLHRVDDLANQPFFVLGGDDNGDTGIGHRLGQSVRSGGSVASAISQVARRGPAESRQYSDRRAARSTLRAAPRRALLQSLICLRRRGLTRTIRLTIRC